jgi:hypothetical protein
MASAGNPFLNRPSGSYLPLRDKPIVVTTRNITSGGRANKLEYYLLTKPNTIPERADKGLLYPTPNFLRNEILKKLRKQAFTRITVTGDIRITTNSDIRVAQT